MTEKNLKKDENKIVKIGSYEYGTKENILYYNEPIRNKSGDITGIQSTGIANHIPVLKFIRNINDGTQTTQEIVFQVYMNGRNIGEYSVPQKTILNGQPNEKFPPGCRIYLEKGAKGRYSEFMQIQCENADCQTVYRHTGYIEENGKRVFLNGGKSITADGLTDEFTVDLGGKLENYYFLDNQNPDKYKTLLKLFKVAPDDVIIPLLAYTFLTPLNGILRDAGIEPRFALYIIGRSNSFKTTLSCLFISFFGIFKELEQLPASFEDTLNSIGTVMSLLDSSLLLLDDRYLDTTQKDKIKNLAVEQGVCRLIGNRTGKGRLNSDSSLKSVYRPKSNVIITAEQGLSQVGESAVARTYAVEVKKGTVNTDILTDVQMNVEDLNGCMVEYIQYILQNWDNISKNIHSEFNDLRKKALTGSFPRIASSIAHLQIGLNYFCEWLTNIKVFTPEFSEKLKTKAWNIFCEIGKRQYKRIDEENPVKMFLSAFSELLNRKKIRLNKINGNSDVPNCIGFEDDDYFYLYPNSMFSEIKNFYREQDTNFPLTSRALFQQLKDEGLIFPDKNQTCKVKKINGKPTRFLWLKKSALQQIEGKEE